MPDTRTPKPRKDVAANVAAAVDLMARAEAAMQPNLDRFEAAIKEMLSTISNDPHPRLAIVRKEVYDVKDQVRLMKKSISAFRRKSKKVGKIIFDPKTDMKEVLKSVRGQRTVLRDLHKNYHKLNGMRDDLTRLLQGAKKMTAAELVQKQAQLKRRVKRLRRARRAAKKGPT
jgi:hypothetical protein